MKTGHLQIMLIITTLSACAELEMSPPIVIPDKIPEAQNSPNVATNDPAQTEQSFPSDTAADNPFNPNEEEVTQPLQRAPDLPAGANELIDGVPSEQQEEQLTPCDGKVRRADATVTSLSGVITDKGARIVQLDSTQHAVW